MRASTIRLTAAAAAPSTRAVAYRRVHAQAFRPVQTGKILPSHIRLSSRGYANGAAPPPPSAQSTSGGSGPGNGGTLVILAALAAIAAGGYWFLKPVRDVAAKANTGLEAVKENGGQITDQFAGIAKAFLPPGAMTIYSNIANQPGGINGFLNNLKSGDLQTVIGEIKKVGGDDVKRVVEKVEAKVKEAGGKPENVDWQALAADLKKELPPSGQKAVDFLVGQLPSKEDIESQIAKFKDIGEEQKKKLEDAAKKVMDAVDKAKKEGKGQADAYLKGLKEAAPGDVDSLVKQLKDAAKSVGLPADAAESWLRSKAEDGKFDAEEVARQVGDKLKMATRALPVEPKDVVEQVKQFSPSVAKLLAEAMQQADVVDSRLNKK